MTTPEHERDEDAVRRYVESLALILTQIGLARMPSRVFAALMVTDSGKLTAAELADQLQVSPAAISGAVRYLDQVGMVAREREPGERRDHYRVFDDMWYAAFLKRDRFMIMWRDAATEGVSTLGDETPAGKRLSVMADFLAYVIKEIPAMFDRWHELQKAKEAAEAR